MAIWVLNDDGSSRQPIGFSRSDNALRYPFGDVDHRIQLINVQWGLPKNQIARLRVCRKRTAARRGQILEKFDSRSLGRAQSGDVKPGTKNLVEVLLFNAVVLAFAGYTHAEQVTIKSQALVGIRYDDCCVIDSHKEIPVSSLPLRISFAWWKRNNLEDVIVQIAKVKGLNAGGIAIPFR